MNLVCVTSSRLCDAVQPQAGEEDVNNVDPE